MNTFTCSRVGLGIIKIRCAIPVAVVREFTAVVERCDAHGHYLGHVPGLQGACAEGQTLRELTANLREVIESLLCDEQPTLRVEIVNNETALV